MNEYIKQEDIIRIVEEKQKELCPVGRYGRHYVDGSDREMYDAWKEIIDALKNLPVEDVEEVRHERWIENTFCSCCGGFDEDDEGNIIQSFHSYCPYCGARMDKEDEQDAD